MSNIPHQRQAPVHEAISLYRDAVAVHQSIYTDDDAYRESCGYEDEYVLGKLQEIHTDVDPELLRWIGIWASRSEYVLEPRISTLST